MPRGTFSIFDIPEPYELTCDQTTGKSLEEIDLLFAKDGVKDSILARAVVPGNYDDEKKTSTPILVESA